MMERQHLSVQGRSVLPRSIAPHARRALAKLAIRGSNVQTGEGFRAGLGAIVSAPHALKIGRWVSIGPRSVVQVNGSIGDFCIIGMQVQVVGRDDHAIDEVGTPISLATWVGDRDPTDRDRIEIGRDVWIGAASVILSGIRIGEGSIIAAGTVLSRDVPDFSIVAGNPGREVRRRFASSDDEKAHVAKLNSLSEVRP